MIRIANAQFWVHDQDEALAFYTRTLGWEVRSDVTMDEWNFRWLVVGPVGQDDVGLVLMPIPGPPMLDADEQRAARRAGRQGRRRHALPRDRRLPGRLRRAVGARRRVQRPADAAALRHRHVVPRPVRQQRPPDPGARVRPRSPLTPPSTGRVPGIARAPTTQGSGMERRRRSSHAGRALPDPRRGPSPPTAPSAADTRRNHMSVGAMENVLAVDDILDLVRERADEAERIRRIPVDVVGAIRRTGLNSMLLPTALGGAQAPALDVIDAIERIAAVDGSTAWCAVIGCGSNVFAGYMPEAGAREVFADPDRGSATMLAPAGRITEVDGRPVLNGRWPFTSNCLHSEWIGLGALLEQPDGAEPVPRTVFVRADDLDIEDTWDSVGLRGTGSHHVSAHDVVVALDHCASAAAAPWPDGALWRVPVHGVLIPLLVSVPIGIARGALDEIARQVREGRSARRGQLGDDPIGMADWAAADTRVRAARAGVREAVGSAHRRAERSEPVPRSLQARIALACLEACDVAVEVTSVAHRLGGGAAAYHGSPLLRAVNDVLAARQHLLFSHQHRAELGRILAGLDAAYPPFVM